MCPHSPAHSRSGVPDASAPPATRITMNSRINPKPRSNPSEDLDPYLGKGQDGNHEADHKPEVLRELTRLGVWGGFGVLGALGVWGALGAGFCLFWYRI